MPTRTYMGIDARHEHSLRIPRPDLSVRLGTPNACTACHADHGPAWAANAIARWYGPTRRSEHTWGEDLWAGARREPGALRALQSLLSDAATPAIVRASALARLLDYPGEAALRVFTAHLTAAEPLVRLQAVMGLELLVPAERVGHLAPLLSDPIRAVRIEVARLLAAVPIVRFAPADAAALRRALEEYIAAQTINADRPEVHLNLGNLYADQGDAQRAAQAYDTALRLDARFVPAWANRADLEAAQGELDLAERTLRTALRRVPEAAQLHHALGLVLIRQRRGSTALESLREATRLAPDEPRFAYVYGVALHDVVGAARGRAALEAALARFPNDRDLLQAVAAYAQAAGDESAARRHLQRLHSIEDALAGSTP
jgi:tetratricopeptide (TPR) repeat protein